MKNKILLIPGIAFLLVFLIFFYLLLIDRDPSEVPSNLLYKNVPEFKTTTLITNKNFTSQKEFGNEIIMVNFFATWCKPCRDEHVFIKRFANEKGLRIIGINYKDNPEKTLKWLKKLGNPYSDIPLDKNGMIAIEWGVYGIPETFIVGADKKIKYRHVGPITKKLYKKISLLVESLE
tara:strand:+ start:469 stop:999 length:531 start_codon:yes stop_codon:yes gene_type:complete